MLDDITKALGDRSNYINTEIPDYVLTYPSMMTLEEKSLLFRLANGYYNGEGYIIDAGVFLGASSNAFAAGMKGNPVATNNAKHLHTKPIQSYDSAIWNSAFNKYLERPEFCSFLDKRMKGRRFADGQDYSHILRDLLELHTDVIEFSIGDIVQEAKSDGPIELAFFDCLKNYERDWAAFKAFAPHYIPGRTIVVQQDYFYEDALENKIRQEFLHPYFLFLGSVASTAVFKLERKIPDEYFGHDPILGLTTTEKLSFMTTAANRIPRTKYRLYTELAGVKLMIASGELDRANCSLRTIERTIANTPTFAGRPASVASKLRAWLNGRMGSAMVDEMDIVDTALAADQFGILASAVIAAGLIETIRGGGPFTVFAPTDDAFAKLPDGMVQELLKPENKEKLTAILKYHVVPGKFTAADVVKLKEAKTLNGATIKITVDGGKVKVNEANVTKPDIGASNGVIHFVDTVIMPPEANHSHLV